MSNITCERIKDGEVECHNITYVEEVIINYTSEWFWIYLGIYVFLVLFAGMMSGLTLGLLSLDLTSLNILQMAGTPKQKKHAARIMPIIRHHHLLLVTLLLANAVAVEAMPLFMDKISNEIVAIVVSVTAVLFFGEVLPQAVCSRYGLAIGANLAPLVYFLMGLCFLISWPIAKLLDCLLGKDHRTFFRRAEIKALVDLHGPSMAEKQVEDPLSADEVLIIKGALEMRDKVASDAMVPLESVFMLDVNARMDHTTINKVLKAAHSRIPVYEGSKQNILGVLLVKTLLALNPEVKMAVRKLITDPKCFRVVSNFSCRTPLYDLLNEFQKGKGHLALVSATDKEMSELQIGTQSGMPTDRPQLSTQPSHTSDRSEVTGTTTSDGTQQRPGKISEEEFTTAVGIITLEDVIEELLCEEIVDETDIYVDVHKRVLVARARASVIATHQISGRSAQSVPPHRQISGGTLGPPSGRRTTAGRMNRPSSAPQGADEIIDDKQLSEDVPLLR